MINYAIRVLRNRMGIGTPHSLPRVLSAKEDKIPSTLSLLIYGGRIWVVFRGSIQGGQDVSRKRQEGSTPSTATCDPKVSSAIRRRILRWHAFVGPS